MEKKKFMLNSYKRGILDGVIVVKIGIYTPRLGKGGCFHLFDFVTFCLLYLN